MQGGAGTLCVPVSMVSLSFTVASACPLVIYVCFMVRRIRKRLIKDSRVAAHELLARRRAWPPRNMSLPFDVLRASIW